MESQCDIIILAAGSSSRLGTPKQLLLHNENTLLKHSIETALASLAKRVVVVLGASADSIDPGVSNGKLTIITNNEWQEGMASSIRCSLRFLLQQTIAVQNVLFMVCDQPHINTELLDKLITLQKQGKCTIAASKYAGTPGIPVIFSRKYLPELMQLKGDTGAKKLILQYKKEVATVAFPFGDIDIDTEEDYQNLQKSNQKE